MPHVLVVDDVQDSCEMLVRVLERVGYRAHCALGGRAALEFLALGAVPDLIILDAMMPGMNGPEVLREIRASAPTSRTPVVMYSAIGDPAFRARVLELGADDYWVKASWDVERIKAGLEALLPPRTPPPPPQEARPGGPPAAEG